MEEVVHCKDSLSSLLPVVVQVWGNFASVSCDDHMPWSVSASLQAVWSLQWLTAISDYRIVSLDTM